MKRNIFLVCILMTLLFSASLANSATVYFVDNCPMTVMLNEEFTLDVVMDFSDESTLGGGIDISWDPNFLSLISHKLSDTSGFDPSFSDEGQHQTGKIHNLYFGNFGGLSGIKSVAELTFSALNIGESTVHISGVDTNPFVSAETFSPMNVSFGECRVNAVPIPGAVWLLGTGLLGLFGITRKRATK